jgi:hypothetical protein
MSPATHSDGEEGPFEGSRCLAAPAGHWEPATIRRLNEDGTFKIEFDVKEMIVLPYWFGVTRSEISFNDYDRWPAVFERFCSRKGSLGLADLGNILSQIGYRADEHRLSQFWRKSCTKLFNIAEDCADSHVLDRNASYSLFLEAGISAMQVDQPLKSSQEGPNAKAYWNQTRMGGREPSELGRLVTLSDALAALSIAENGNDPPAANLVSQFEQEHEVKLPGNLKQFLTQRGVVQAVTDSHPNNPWLTWPGQEEWQLRPEMKRAGLDGEYAFRLMNHHYYDWYAVFETGDTDARVYLNWQAENSEVWRRVAPSIGMFFWDLAQTGLCWYQDTRFCGGKHVKKTDIGLMPG